MPGVFKMFWQSGSEPRIVSKRGFCAGQSRVVVWLVMVLINGNVLTVVTSLVNVLGVETMNKFVNVVVVWVSDNGFSGGCMGEWSRQWEDQGLKEHWRNYYIRWSSWKSTFEVKVTTASRLLSPGNQKATGWRPLREDLSSWKWKTSLEYAHTHLQRMSLTS